MFAAKPPLLAAEVHDFIQSIQARFITVTLLGYGNLLQNYFQFTIHQSLLRKLYRPVFDTDSAETHNKYSVFFRLSNARRLRWM